jgi:acid phosphatase
MKFFVAIGLALSSSRVVLAASTTYASKPPESTVEPTQPSISAAAATQTASSPVSNVKGAGFDRIVQIWLENTVCILERCLPTSTNVRR